MTEIQAQLQKTSDIQNNKNLAKVKKYKFNIVIFNRCLLGLVVFMGVAYLLCVNDLAIKGFKLGELKKQVSSLSEENNRNELDAMSLKSYANISERVKKLSMVPAGNSVFIEPNMAMVAKR